MQILTGKSELERILHVTKTRLIGHPSECNETKKIEIQIKELEKKIEDY